MNEKKKKRDEPKQKKLKKYENNKKAWEASRNAFIRMIRASFGGKRQDYAFHQLYDSVCHGLYCHCTFTDAVA